MQTDHPGRRDGLLACVRELSKESFGEQADQHLLAFLTVHSARTFYPMPTRLVGDSPLLLSWITRSAAGLLPDDLRQRLVHPADKVRRPPAGKVVVFEGGCHDDAVRRSLLADLNRWHSGLLAEFDETVGAAGTEKPSAFLETAYGELAADDPLKSSNLASFTLPNKAFAFSATGLKSNYVTIDVPYETGFLFFTVFYRF